VTKKTSDPITRLHHNS